MKKKSCIISLLLCIFMLLGTTACSVLDKKPDSEKSSPTPQQEQNSSVNSDNSKTEKNTDKETTKTPSTEKEISYEVTDEYFSYNKNSIGSTEYHAIVEITNTGSENIYLKGATFDLEDDNGHLLQTDNLLGKCPDVIKPGEKGYYYNNLGSLLIDDEVSLENGVNLKYNLDVAKAKKEPVYYSVTDLDMKEDGTFKCPKVTGRIVNESAADENLVYITIIFYNSDGKAIGIADSSASGLKAKSKISFDCSALYLDDAIKYSDIADYKVIASSLYMQF